MIETAIPYGGNESDCQIRSEFLRIFPIRLETAAKEVMLHRIFHKGVLPPGKGRAAFSLLPEREPQ
jgi:hypothetical protein